MCGILYMLYKEQKAMSIGCMFIRTYDPLLQYECSVVSPGGSGHKVSSYTVGLKQFEATGNPNPQPSLRSSVHNRKDLKILAISFNPDMKYCHHRPDIGFELAVVIL